MKSWILTVILCNSLFVFSQRFETVAPGYWTNPAVWLNGQKPDFAFSDTVVIKHPVAFDSTLLVLPGAYFKIDSSGAICGHEKLIAYSTVNVYGYFQLDSIKVDGGYFRIFGPGECIATYQTQVTNGGLMSLTGGSLSVGPWFECRSSDFFYMAEIQEFPTTEVELYPNPVSDYLSLEGDLTAYSVKIKDVSGKIVLEKEAETLLDLRFVSNGVYYLELIKEGEKPCLKKLIVNK